MKNLHFAKSKVVKVKGTLKSDTETHVCVNVHCSCAELRAVVKLVKFVQKQQCINSIRI